MNIEHIIQESALEIKSRWDLPKTGFLSGGSIANLIWEKVSGTKAVINDLDIYHLHSIIEKADELELKEKQSFQNKEKVFYEDYRGIELSLKLSSFYIIEEVTNNGILNEIRYKSNTDNPKIIIESFDINCCQVGYDLETGKSYWTKEFLEFLETGELRLINLSSPAHSAMRLVKKHIDLNVKLPELELDLIAYSLNNPSFKDTNKRRFKQKYANMFREYRSGLESRFELVRDFDLETHLSLNLKIYDKIYKLEPRSPGLNITNTQGVGFHLSRDFIFWIRNIFGNPNLEKIWSNLYLVFDYNLGMEKYLDCHPDESQINLINRLVMNAPNCARHLIGFTLSRQLYIVNELLDKFSHDPIVAISILETYSITGDINLENEMDLLLLELSVRKKILDDPKNKVKKILNPHSELKELVGYSPFLLGAQI